MTGPVKRLLAAAVLVALASAPTLAQAATVNGAPLAPAAVAQSVGEPPVGSTPAGAAAGDTADYAAREAAAPELGKFQGGSVVIFIGGGAVFVLVIVLIVLLV